MKQILIGVVAVLGVVLGGLALVRPSASVAPVGGIGGPDFFFPTNFHEVATMGGQRLATTSAGTVTYTTSNITPVKLVEHIASGALTASLPTNASLTAAGFLPNAGDTFTMYIHASTTAITLAGNTGVILYTASSTKSIATGSIGRLDFVRLGATEAKNILVLLTAD